MFYAFPLLFINLQMPVVTRADCTQTDVQEHYMFLKDPAAGISGVIDKMTVKFSSCQGANNKNNDLTAFVQQLVDDEKVGTNEQESFALRVVGNDQCPTKRSDLLEVSDYEKGYYIDESKWDYIVGKLKKQALLVVCRYPHLNG